MVERTSRFVVLAKLDEPTAECAAQAITREMSRIALSTEYHDARSRL